MTYMTYKLSCFFVKSKFTSTTRTKRDSLPQPCTKNNFEQKDETHVPSQIGTKISQIKTHRNLSCDECKDRKTETLGNSLHAELAQQRKQPPHT